MLYLEDFLEVIENIPQEIKERSNDLKELDLGIHSTSEQLEEQIKNYFNNAKKMKVQDRNNVFEKIRKEYYKLLDDADEKVATVDCPTLKSDEVLVQVKVCGVNFYDLYVSKGLSPNKNLPYTFGLECSGLIVKVGAFVKHFEVGDRVIVYTPEGDAFAEYVAAVERRVKKLPNEISYETAAALTINYLTAYMALEVIAKIDDNNSIFIQGAAGGVGWATTQLAKLHSNVRVFGTASKMKHQAIKQNGVDVCLTYEDDLKETIYQYTTDGVSLAIDNMAGKNLEECQEIVAPLGTTIIIGAKNFISPNSFHFWNILKTWWTTKFVKPSDLIMGNKKVAGLHLQLLYDKCPEVFVSAWDYIVDLCSRGKINPHIHAMFSLEESSKALAVLERRENIGKILLIPHK